MLNSLVEASLRYKFLVLIAFGVIAFLGWRAIFSVPIDAFPDVTPAQVNIYTESPGLAAEDVEQLLTFHMQWLHAQGLQPDRVVDQYFMGKSVLDDRPVAAVFVSVWDSAVDFRLQGITVAGLACPTAWTAASAWPRARTSASAHGSSTVARSRRRRRGRPARGPPAS